MKLLRLLCYIFFLRLKGAQRLQLHPYHFDKKKLALTYSGWAFLLFAAFYNRFAKLTILGHKKENFLSI